MKVLIAGVGGMVGRAVEQYCVSLQDLAIGLDHAALDIADLKHVTMVLNQVKPDVVINCAAWTDVDGCESDRQRAYAANALGPENLATVCRQIAAGFVTISTDYVFDGTKDGFYTQRDDPNPQSVYANTKLEGERKATLAYARTIVVRSGFIFGPHGKNFLSTVVTRVRENEPIKAIADSWGTPTYALDLARRLRELAELDLPGTYHVVNSGRGASYLEFAKTAIEVTGSSVSTIESVTEESLRRPAPRPRNSRLRCLLSEGLRLEPLPLWEDGLRHFAASKPQIESAART